MKILADIPEAAERFEALIDFALRGEEVLICRAGQPVVVLAAIRKPSQGTIDDFWRWQPRAARRSVTKTSNHDELYDENGLPK